MVDERDPKAPVGRASPGASTEQGGDALATTQPGGRATPTQDTVVPARRPTAPPLELPPAGYQIGELIGRGGMGEVMAAHDQRIGREVAIKRMRSARPDGEQLARFLREARIQARLDHPAIVPVHELGTDEAGRPFFTMKRVSGRTLAEKLTDGASLQSLLRAFVDVCLAVDLAHSRAVIHRDLKPANIMLGDYGEVYVLDWGVARVLTDHDNAPAQDDIDTLDEGTQTGAMLGTPGYMAPEQIKGQPATQAADIYALGAILFEILAHEPLHPRGGEAISSTLTKPQDSPARRRSDRAVPPELDMICHAALAELPIDRPTARRLADQVQAYLDGDRDVERRRRLAGEQLALAHAALVEGGADARATAIRRAGRAVALDPESPDAADLVTSLIIEPPKVLPPELVKELEDEERANTSKRSKAGVYAYLSFFALWLLFPFLGVKNWTTLFVLYGVLGAMALYAWYASKLGRFNIIIGLAGNFVLAIVFSRVAGPFMVMPVILCGVLIFLTTAQWLIERRWLVVGWTAASILTPVGLEAAGWLNTTWAVHRDSIVSHSQVFEMEGAIADATLIVGNIAFVALVGLMAITIHKTSKQAKRQVAVQAWHLKHLLPRTRRWVTQR